MTAKELLLHITTRACNTDEMALLSDVLPWRFVPTDRLEHGPDRDLTDEAVQRRYIPCIKAIDEADRCQRRA